MGNWLKQIQFSDHGWVQDTGSSWLQRAGISELQTLLRKDLGVSKAETQIIGKDIYNVLAHALRLFLHIISP